MCEDGEMSHFRNRNKYPLSQRIRVFDQVLCSATNYARKRTSSSPLIPSAFSTQTAKRHDGRSRQKTPRSMARAK